MWHINDVHQNSCSFTAVLSFWSITQPFPNWHLLLVTMGGNLTVDQFIFNFQISDIKKQKYANCNKNDELETNKDDTLAVEQDQKNEHNEETSEDEGPTLPMGLTGKHISEV